MGLPRLNAFQKSLLIPSGVSFVLGGLLGLGGLTIGSLAALPASPVIYWIGANKEKAKWKRVLTASLLSGSGMLLSFISGWIGAESLLKAVRPDAYRQFTMETNTESQQRVAAAPPEEQVKPTFTATANPGETNPVVTQGTAILNKKTKTLEWYKDLYGDGKYKRRSRCLANGDYEEITYYTFLIPTNGIWANPGGMRCDISVAADNAQIKVKVVRPSDGYIYQLVQVTTSAASKPKSP